MKKLLLVLISFCAIISASSCREDFETTLSDGRLGFSRDTVFLDTVFSNIGSSTYSFKVYNRSNSLITIPEVGLSQGENSNYRLNIDGLAGKTFQNIEILPKDSIYIFIEVTVDAAIQNENRFLYTDQILFDSGANLQQVELVTLIQDAIFLFPQRDEMGIKETLNLGTDEDGELIEVEGFILNDNQLNFTKEKPYVIYGYAGIAGGKTLSIEAGSRIYFHQNSGIILSDTAHLEAAGSLSDDQSLMENEIIMEGDRLEPEFSSVAGQWGTIWFTPGSTGNFKYTTIKNSSIGILAEGISAEENPAVYLKNTQIYNSSLIGIYGITGSVLGENLVVGNSGISNLWLRLGGYYRFIHSTFANYWSQSFRNTPAVQIDNYLETETGLLVSDLINATFINCIIYGNKSEELSLKSIASANFKFKFDSCLLRFDNLYNDFSELPNYNFNNENLYSSVLRSENPIFKNTSAMDYRIDTNSAAKGLGSQQGAQQVPLDILGKSRIESIDSGAYQTISFEDN